MQALALACAEPLGRSQDFQRLKQEAEDAHAEAASLMPALAAASREVEELQAVAQAVEQ